MGMVLNKLYAAIVSLYAAVARAALPMVERERKPVVERGVTSLTGFLSSASEISASCEELLCPICLASLFTNEAALVVTQTRCCSQYFHRPRLERALDRNLNSSYEKNKTCPLCRADKVIDEFCDLETKLQLLSQRRRLPRLRWIVVWVQLLLR